MEIKSIKEIMEVFSKVGDEKLRKLLAYRYCGIYEEVLQDLRIVGYKGTPHPSTEDVKNLEQYFKNLLIADGVLSLNEVLRSEEETIYRHVSGGDGYRPKVHNMAYGKEIVEYTEERYSLQLPNGRSDTFGKYESVDTYTLRDAYFDKYFGGANAAEVSQKISALGSAQKLAVWFFLQNPTAEEVTIEAKGYNEKSFYVFSLENIKSVYSWKEHPINKNCRMRSDDENHIFYNDGSKTEIVSRLFDGKVFQDNCGNVYFRNRNSSFECSVFMNCPEIGKEEDAIHIDLQYLPKGNVLILGENIFLSEDSKFWNIEKISAGDLEKAQKENDEFKEKIQKRKDEVLVLKLLHNSETIADDIERYAHDELRKECTEDDWTLVLPNHPHYRWGDSNIFKVVVLHRNLSKHIKDGVLELKVPSTPKSLVIGKDGENINALTEKLKMVAPKLKKIVLI